MTSVRTPSPSSVRLHAASGLKEAALIDRDEEEAHEVGEGRHEAEYDWTEEWYPLYLTGDVPEDAPLGLKVFDKQLVLYRDGGGALRCYEDRCPHR